MEVVERLKGFMPEEGINPEELSPSMAHVWFWYLALNSKRSVGLNGVTPIAESEIGWFFRNRQIEVQPWEVEAINRIDFLAYAEKG